MFRDLRKMKASSQITIAIGVFAIIVGSYVFSPLFFKFSIGEVVWEKRISLSSKTNGDFIILNPGLRSLYFKVKIKCFKFTGVGDDVRGLFYYPFKYNLRSENGEVLMDKSGVLSSDAESTINSFSFSNSFYTGNLSPTQYVNESFWAPISKLSLEKPTTYRISMNVLPDTKYQSQLVEGKIVVTEGVKADKNVPLIMGLMLILAGVFMIGFIFVKENVAITT